jgi:hypothetical protein
VSIFDKSQHSCGFEPPSKPKALTSQICSEELLFLPGKSGAAPASTGGYPTASDPREWAEGLAKLHPDYLPGDVPLSRWLQFIDDCGRAVDTGFVEKAAELGWTAIDQFGCDRDRPFARIDHAGLLWLLNGDKLIELDRHKALIETRTGALQSYRRKPVAVGEMVLAWKLEP